MAAIQLNFPQLPDFRATNNLLIAGNEGIQKGLQGAADVAQAVVKAQNARNTADIVQAVNSAQTLDAFNSADNQARINALREQAGTNYDPIAVVNAISTRPAALIQQENNLLQQQQTQREIAAAPVVNSLMAAGLAGDTNQFKTQLTNLPDGVTVPVGAVNTLTNRLDAEQKRLNDNRDYEARQIQNSIENKQRSQQIAIAATNANINAMQAYGSLQKSGGVYDSNGNLLPPPDYYMPGSTNSSSNGDITANQYTSVADAVAGVRAGTGTRESGNNYQAPNAAGASSAFGKYQITDQTWTGIQKSIPEYANLTPAAWNKLRTDPTAQEKAFEALTTENATALQDMGVPLNNGTIYAAHFLGLGKNQREKTKELLTTAPADAPIRNYISEGAYNANKSVFDNNPTVGKFREFTMGKQSGSTSNTTNDPNADGQRTLLSANKVSEISSQYRAEISKLQSDYQVERYKATMNPDPSKTTTAFVQKFDSGVINQGTKLLNIATQSKGWEKLTEGERFNTLSIMQMALDTNSLTKATGTWFSDDNNLKELAQKSINSIIESNAKALTTQESQRLDSAVNKLIAASGNKLTLEGAYKILGVPFEKGQPKVDKNPAQIVQDQVNAELEKQKPKSTGIAAKYSDPVTIAGKPAPPTKTGVDVLNNVLINPEQYNKFR